MENPPHHMSEYSSALCCIALTLLEFPWMEVPLDFGQCFCWVISSMRSAGSPSSYFVCSTNVGDTQSLIKRLLARNIPTRICETARLAPRWHKYKRCFIHPVTHSCTQFSLLCYLSLGGKILERYCWEGKQPSDSVIVNIPKG